MSAVQRFIQYTSPTNGNGVLRTQSGVTAAALPQNGSVRAAALPTPVPIIDDDVLQTQAVTQTAATLAAQNGAEQTFCIESPTKVLCITIRDK